MQTKILLKSVICAAVSAAVTLPAYSRQLEEVVVTARKKEENIQDVPVAVTAISGEDVSNAFLLDTTSISQFAPNLVMDNVEAGTPSNGGFAIRGIGYQDVEKSFDPTVLVAVDNVPMSTAVGSVFDLLDVESIEVLRGPQGTLFGKNVVGGLINIHRKKPQLDETSGKFRLRAGDYEKTQADLLYNYGEDNWAVKLNLGTSRQAEGYAENIGPADDPDKRDTQHAGIHVLWEASDTFTAQAQLNYSKMEGNSGAWLNTTTDERDFLCLVSVTAGSPKCSFGDYGDPHTGDRRKVDTDFNDRVQLESVQFITELNAEVSDTLTLTYVGGYVTSNDLYTKDGDATSLPMYHLERWGDFEQVTNEIRLSRDAGDNLSWQAGLFFSNVDTTAYQITDTFYINAWTDVVVNGADPDLAFDLSDPLGYGGFGPTENAITTASSRSAYFEGDYRMLDNRLTLNAGLRFVSETKEISRANPGAGLDLGVHGKRTDNDWVYRWGFRYQFTDDVMAYFSNSTGFRSGGFSPRSNDIADLQTGFAPETLTNFEAGVKTTLFDGRMTLNATIFHMVYDDMQVEISLPSAGATANQLSIQNAGKAEFDGIEVETELFITDFWRVAANVGTLDAKYKEFFGDLYGDGMAVDNSDLDIRRAPELTYSINSTMDFNVGRGALTWRLGYSWKDDYEMSSVNFIGTSIDAYGVLDTSLMYTLDNWKFSVFGRNLTDEDAYTHDYPAAPNRPTAGSPNNGTFWKFALPRAPREWGAEVSYSF